MHDHNLDDLIIDNIEPNNSKTKSFLTIIALMIVVLIVAIILTKILLKTPEENALAFEEDATEMIAPELKLKERPKSEKAEEEPSLSKIIDNEVEEPKVKTNKPVVTEEPSVVIENEKIKPKLNMPEVPKVVEAKKEPELSNIQDQEIEVPLPETKEPVTAQEPLLNQKEKEAQDKADMEYWKTVQEERKAERIAKQTSTEEAKEEVQINAPVKPKKIEAPIIKTPKAVATKPVSESLSTGNYYIQVGSFKTQPSTRFTSVIRNNGFNYTIKRAGDGNNKLLIGPYQDRASVNSALVIVKDRINKSAFVVKR